MTRTDASAFDGSLLAELAELEGRGLRREPPEVASPQGPEITIAGRPRLCLASNNYLGLANHPDLTAAVAAGASAHGVGSGASRLVSGTMSPHASAERALAAYVGQESALLFSSGYAANVGAISAFAGPEDLILSDALNHASIIDGCRLSGARVVVYPHGDFGFVRAALARERSAARRALVITEAVFSMDGDAAPVAALANAAKDFDAALYVDEAHSLGVLGPAGRGLLAQTGTRANVVLGTLGKSFGAFGAFIATSAAGVAWLKHRARSFVFSTAPPPLLGPVAEAALRLVTQADAERSRVIAHGNAIRSALRDRGVSISCDDSPIVPVILGSPERATAASAALLARDVFVQAIRPPTVPEGTSRLRIVPMASHSEAQIAGAIDALSAVLT